MLRELIFSFVSGGVIGVAIGALVLYSSWLTEAIRCFLRIALWFPLVIIFAATAPFILGVTAVMLCTCYHYIAARSSLGLQGRHAWTYAAREAILQVLFISLISQLWSQHWRWFSFSILQKPVMGLEVFAVLAALIGSINWCFQSSFMLTANRRAAMQIKEINGEGWMSICHFILLTLACLVIWQLVSASGLNFLQTSAYEALTTAYYLVSHGKIWGDMGLSLLEVIGGIVLGGSAALGVLVPLSTKGTFRNLLFPLLPLTYISAIVLWLVVFVSWLNWVGVSQPEFLYFWHKVIAVGCLTFFPLVQALWGSRKGPLFYRVLMAIDDALPIAFVGMVFGEAWAATQGLGFAMVVANASGQTAKGIAGFLITFALMVGLSFTLRWLVKKLYCSVGTPHILPA